MNSFSISPQGRWSRCFILAPLTFLVMICWATPVVAQPTRIATWNIEHLRSDEGEGPIPRTQPDYLALRVLAANADADIWAIQEVENAEAAHKVFPASEYEIFLSNRNHPQRVGFAVRHGISVVEESDFVGLGLGGEFRFGKHLVVEISSTTVHLLAIHLKSGCFIQPLETAIDACEALLAQLPILESWIDERSENDERFIVLGDFNRRLDQDGGQFFDEINDDEPSGLSLVGAGFGHESSCRDGIFPNFIDHLIVDGELSSHLVEGSFREMMVSANLADKFRVSDHCAVSIDIEEPGDVEEVPRPSVLDRLNELERRLDELRSEIIPN